MTFSTQTTQSIDKLHQLIDASEQIIIGKKEVTRLTIVAMLAGGHVLFEDIPGVGKTLLIRTIAQCLAADFSRIQFTPDLIPSDIIGYTVPHADKALVDFRKGPIFNQLLLADEINRTSPRTQAAMLEAMSEKQVTVDGMTYSLPEPFFVLATQNPIEYEGTYPLPEAQLDRFLFQLSLGYPTTDQEVTMLASPDQQKAVEQLNPVMTLDEFLSLKDAVQTVFVEERLLHYIISLASLTREHSAIRLGVSPRGNQYFLSAARANALVEGRDFVTPQDILTVLKPVYRHRLLFENDMTKSEIDTFIDDLADNLVVPTVRGKRPWD